MSTGKDSAKGKSSKLAVVMYVGAVVSAVIAIYMVVTSVSYINGYAASYGMGFGDMWADGIQYILTNSVSYIVYALVLLGLGKILDILQKGKPAEEDEQPVLSEATGIITGDKDGTETEETTEEDPQKDEDADNKSEEKAE